MRDRVASGPEIESFNLADLDVAALDVRLELASLIPACLLVDCVGNCSHNCERHCVVDCQFDTGCNDHG